MAFTVSRNTAKQKKLAVRRKNWQILSVSPHKKGNLVLTTKLKT